MPRFFYPGALQIGMTVDLPDTLVRHCHVLRLKLADQIILFNGTGGCFTAGLSRIEKKLIQAEIQTSNNDEVELPYSLTLAQALPEAGKTDWIIEKAVELGANEFQPLQAHRCVTKLSPERAEKRLKHWQGIVASACEQSGRNRLVQLGTVAEFKLWMSQPHSHRRILLNPKAKQSLSDWVRQQPVQALTLIVGPEGGFTDQEIELAITMGALNLSMGPRILRAETAGLAAISIINAHWGGM